MLASRPVPRGVARFVAMLSWFQAEPLLYATFAWDGACGDAGMFGSDTWAYRPGNAGGAYVDIDKDTNAMRIYA
eukprot:8199679-Alexandrium_andersonii.AAC.1